MGSNFVDQVLDGVVLDAHLEESISVSMTGGVEAHVGQPFGNGDQLIRFEPPANLSVLADEPPLINPESSDTLDSAHVECFSRYQWLVVGAPELVYPPHTLTMQA